MAGDSAAERARSLPAFGRRIKIILICVGSRDALKDRRAFKQVNFAHRVETRKCKLATGFPRYALYFVCLNGVVDLHFTPRRSQPKFDDGTWDPCIGGEKGI